MKYLLDSDALSDLYDPEASGHEAMTGHLATLVQSKQFAAAKFSCATALSSVWRLGTRKPFDVLLTLPAQVRDTLAAKECIVALHSLLDGAMRELPERLTILLAVENRCSQRRAIEIC